MKISQPIIATAFGFLTLSLQLVLIRSALEIFQGNELTIGLALAVWLTGSAAGSLWLFRLVNRYAKSHWLLFSLLPVCWLDFMMIKFIPRIFGFIPGTFHALLQVLVVYAVTILPLATLCGALFPLLVHWFSPEGNKNIPMFIRRVYIWESLGALLAAVLLNVMLFHLFLGYQVMLLALLIFYLALMYRSQRENGKSVIHYLPGMYSLLILLLLLTSGIFLKVTYQTVYAPYQVLEEKDTPYGNHKLLEREGQTLVVSQGVIGYSFPDQFAAELRALVPLAGHTDPRSLLVIGGNVNHYRPFLSRFDALHKVVFLEKDPYLLSLQKRLWHADSLPSAPEVRMVREDIRSFLRRDPDRYDVIALNQPEPATLSENRFYTREFFSLLHRSLSPGGLLYFSIRSSENYINPPLANYITLLDTTLRAVFRQVFIIPGDENLFLASDSPAFLANLQDWSGQMQQREIEPEYLTVPYWNYRLSPDRLRHFQRQLEKGSASEINRDFNLKGYLYHFLVWGGVIDPAVQGVFIRIFAHERLLIISFFIILLVLQFLWGRNERSRILFSLFLAGGVAMALQIILLLQYQILVGTVYSSMAMIFGLFMLGLALGAWREAQVVQTVRLVYFWWGFALVTVILTLPVMIPIAGEVWLEVYQWIFSPAIVFAVGWLLGGYFVMSSHIYYQANPDGNPGMTYGIDLAGGVFSAFFVSIVLVPVLGIGGTLGLILLLVVFQVVFGRVFPKSG